MHLDVVAHDELHARESDAVGGQAPPAKCRGRIGEVEHHLGARRRDVFEIELFRLEVGGSLVNEAFVPLGAGHRHLLFVMEDAASHCRCRRPPAGPIRG